MKKLLMVMAVFLLMAGVSHGAITQTIAVVETTTSSMSISDDYSIDGDVKAIYLYWAEGRNLGEGALSLVDSIKQGDTPTDPDTFVVTGLTHNTYYSFMVVMLDSVYAHADSVHYDSTDVSSYTTEGIGITLTAEDVTYRGVIAHIELTNVDSAAKSISLQYHDPDSAWTAWSDTITSIDNDDDSLAFPTAPSDLMRNKYYDMRVVVTDSTGTDTSSVTSFLTLDFDWGTWGEPAGWVEPNLYHVKYSWSNSATTLSLPFSIVDKSWVKIWALLIGFDNNEANDSAYVYLASYAHGDQVFGDTLIAADVDTGRVAEAWFLKPVVSNEVDTLVGTWGTDLVLKAMSTSGDTTAIDTRYLDVWLMFK